MMQTEKIFHYTSIDSLALILNSKNIRFARLDTVDDMTEAQTHEGIEFGKYFFISCWTQEESENIAQWKMYGGDMQGVRLELPANPFRKIKLESMPGFVVDNSREYFSPLASSDLFGKNYFIMPMMPYGDQFFSGAVDYISDVESRWKAAFQRTPDYSGRRASGTQITKMFDLVRLKNSMWEFQSEFRFFLFAPPMNPPFDPSVASIPTPEQFASMWDAMQMKVDSGVTYLDIPMAEAALNQLVVRMGPLCSLADRICVEAIVEKLAPTAKIEFSHLTNKLRSRSR